MKRIVACIILKLLLLGNLGWAASFRGLPYYAKIDSLTWREAAGPNNFVDICYRFSTTTPIFDYSDLASKLLRGFPVTVMPSPIYGSHGDPQPSGIPFRFAVFGFTIVAYISSEATAFALPQMTFFNSAVRSFAGEAKPLDLKSHERSFQSMVYPQYEWVTTCETVPFGKAFSKQYVFNLFDGPGPIGHFTGRAQFSFNLFPPPMVSTQPIAVGLNGSEYAVPIFGRKPLSAGDLRMISVSHFINSLNALKANVDEGLLNSFLANHRDIITLFENHYRVNVQLPLDAEGIVALFHRIANLENPSAD